MFSVSMFSVSKLPVSKLSVLKLSVIVYVIISYNMFVILKLKDTRRVKYRSILYLHYSTIFTDAFAMRRSRLKYVAATIIAATIYIVLSERNWAWYSSKETTVCKTPEGEMKDLVSLAHDTREILQKLNMTYFLIYGRWVWPWFHFLVAYFYIIPDTPCIASVLYN